MSMKSFYRGERVVALFLTSIQSSTSSQIQGAILSRVTLLSLIEAFNVLKRVLDFPPISMALIIYLPSTSKSTAFVTLGSQTSQRSGTSEHSQGRGQDQSHRHGRDGLSYPLCEHCGKIKHHFDKSWKNSGKPPFCMATHVMTTPMPPLLPAPTMMPLAPSGMITLPCEEYDQLMH